MTHGGSDTPTTSPMSALRGLVDVARLVRRGPALDELLQRLAEILSASLGFATVAVNLYRPADDEFAVTTIVGPEEAMVLLGSRSSARRWTELILDPAFERDGVFFVPEGTLDWDASDGEVYVPPARDPDDASDARWRPEDALFAPMRSSTGELLGVLSVDDPASGRRPDAVTLQVLAAAGTHAGLGIEQRQSELRAAAQAASLERLLTVVARMADTLDADVALDMVCAAVRDAFGFGDVVVALCEDAESFTAAAAAPFTLARERLEQLLDAGTRVAGVTLLEPEDARRLWPVDLPEHANGTGPTAWRGHLVLVPLRDARGGLIGVLRTAEPADRLIPDHDRLAALYMFGVQAAATLDTAVQRALREERDRAVYLATHDTLTDLANRAALRQALATRLDEGRPCAVLVVDLDDFKLINDALGHHHGDDVLREVAARLRASLVDVDLVCRLGGDEFGVLVDGDARDAERAGEDVRRLLTEAVDVAGVEHRLTASAGIAVAEPGQTAADVLRHADIAMYQAKAAGGATAVRYAAETDAAAGRLATLTALRGAIARDELELHYQPIVRADDQRPVALEALIRWRREDGLVPPASFIPLAESSELIESIGSWVIDEAARQAQAWRAAGLTVPPIAVNISPRQLQRPGLDVTLASALDRWDLPSSALSVEITESALSVDRQVSDYLKQLRDAGIRRAIDDFGAQWSSLGRLLELPVDVVKIDRAFLRDVPGDPRAVGLLRAIADMARAIDLDVVVEGVETAEQHAVVRALGDEVTCQGFLFSRPLAPDAAGDYLKRAT
jgi:diguanylate cyclase (GGDEF)-like protein